MELESILVLSLEYVDEFEMETFLVEEYPFEEYRREERKGEGLERPLLHEVEKIDGEEILQLKTTHSSNIIHLN